MAMNGVSLGDSIVTFLKTLNPNIDVTQEALLKGYWEGIGTAIVDHIKNNADVISTAHSGPDLKANTGIPVAVSTVTGIGATTAQGPLGGKGSIQ